MNAPENRHLYHQLSELAFDNSFSQLPEAFFTRLAPTPLPSPYFIAGSDEAAALIGLHPSVFTQAEFAAVFSGNRALPGGSSLAAVYSGHQFGIWAGQLGDGRAHHLGGLRNDQGHWELQLKGAGKTPYSRGADGRAVLRSSIREFLCSEAMAGLGIATTRALCLIGSDLPVRRETIESAAVVTRLSESFVRFGSFEHWAALGRKRELQQLADYVIDNFRPALRDSAQPYVALLADVAERTGRLIAQWMGVGFMHGVMNTDNMSILGQTIDYGPFGFMEAFDAGHICNHSDTYGRYSYRNQPRIAQWNLYCLADALLPLIGDPELARETVDRGFIDTYEHCFSELMGKKLGLRAADDSDDDFIGETFGLLQAHRPDFTLFFRMLSKLAAEPGETKAKNSDAPLRDLFVDREACDNWLGHWRMRLALTPWSDAERQSSMLAINPKYVLRNWLAESAIRPARHGDYSEIHRLLDCLRQPYAEQPHYELYAALPPDWANGLEVSCSS